MSAATLPAGPRGLTGISPPRPRGCHGGDLPEPGAPRRGGSLRQRTDRREGQGPGAEDSKGTPQGEIQDEGLVAGLGRAEPGLRGEVEGAAGFLQGQQDFTREEGL